MSFSKYNDLYQQTNLESGTEYVKLTEVSADTPYNELDGSIQWFTFHRGASGYPENPSPYTQERMKNFILGIYLILRCEKCSEHAQQYVDEMESAGLLDIVVKSRDNLEVFFVDFHNYVNERQGKKIFKHEEAKSFYSKTFKAVYG